MICQRCHGAKTQKLFGFNCAGEVRASGNVPCFACNGTGQNPEPFITVPGELDEQPQRDPAKERRKRP